MKLTVKGGAAVDPDTGLEDCAHVLEQNGKIYSATLGLVDIVRGTNSYYKLQLLEDDVQKRWVCLVFCLFLGSAVNVCQYFLFQCKALGKLNEGEEM